MNDPVIIGRRVRTLRERAALTQEELAARASLAVRTVNNLENGRYGHRGRTLRRIAKALGCSVEALMPPIDLQAAS